MKKRFLVTGSQFLTVVSVSSLITMLSVAVTFHYAKKIGESIACLKLKAVAQDVRDRKVVMAYPIKNEQGAIFGINKAVSTICTE